MRTHTAIVMCGLVLFGNLNASDSRISGDSPKPGTRLSDERALELALRYTGFDKWETFSVEKNLKSIGLTVLHDITTPFLTAQLNGREAVEVQFEDVMMELPRSVSGFNQSNPKNFHVYLDATTGQLLKIIGLAPEKSLNDLAPKPPAWCAEKQYWAARQKYIGLVEKLSGATLGEALNETYANPAAARELVALPVVFVRTDLNDTVSAWDIHLFDAPPIPLHNRNARAPVEHLNHWRTVIRLDSLEWGYGSNIPQPGVCDEYDWIDLDTLDW